VASVWGFTNPLLKRGNESTRSVAPSGRGPVVDGLRQVGATLLNWRFSVPFLVNQSGSFLYVYLLGSSEISMAVPICNSLTLVVTALASWALGERDGGRLTPRTAAGTALILAGIAVCVMEKQAGASDAAAAATSATR
jgi:drug/metabolite transporter (DMT)-like permease